VICSSFVPCRTPTLSTTVHITDVTEDSTFHGKMMDRLLHVCVHLLQAVEDGIKCQ
jgi:hypothetical protein